MKKHKRLLVAAIAVLVMITLLGCEMTTTKSFTFNVDNGDAIRLSLNINDDYDISSELPFEISCNGEVLCQGTFIQSEAYSQYVAVVQNDENATLLDSGIKEGNEYIFWNYNDTEFNYAILIADSNTGIILGNDVSEESARECFNRLTITAED